MIKATHNVALVNRSMCAPKCHREPLGHAGGPVAPLYTPQVCNRDMIGLTGALDAAAVRVRLHENPTPESPMKFLITALDTSGSVTLQRESVPAAMKKAAELISDGCWDVEIIAPDGAAYHPGEFERLKE